MERLSSSGIDKAIKRREGRKGFKCHQTKELTPG
jgi:hypothetical protein